MIEALFLASMMAAQAPDDPQIRFLDTAIIEDRTITLEDVADLQTLPTEWRRRAGALVLYSWDGNRPMVIDHAAIASRSRALMPALVPWLRGPFNGSVRLAHDSSRRDFLPVACENADEGVEKGDKLVVKIMAGPFQIERQTLALQSTKADQRFFVKTADGDVLAVQCGGAD